MNYTIENEHLRVTISSAGAEVQSVTRKRDGQEMWWQGDPQYWGGRSPILFPACGGLWDGKYTHDGVEYQMPKHGFAKKMEWQYEPQDEATTAVFSICDTEETWEHYPFHFALYISYSLIENNLVCQFALQNLEQEEFLHFQIGGHPAIALPDFREDADVIGYIQPLVTDNEEIDARLLSVVRAGEQGCYSRDRHPVPTSEEGLIPISNSTFANEALIFDHSLIAGARILDAQKQVLATVRSESPVWLFWQQQTHLCPFICAEPWYGLCDRQGDSVQLIDRPYSQNVAPDGLTQGLLWEVEV